MSEVARPLMPLIVVGAGSPNGDDQAGWAAVDRLRARLGATSPPATRSARSRPARLFKVANPLDLTQLLVDPELVALAAEWLIIDAAGPCGSAGALRRFPWPLPPATPRLLSSHSLGLSEAIRLAEAVAGLPSQLGIWTVEAEDVSPVPKLSPRVEAGIDAIVDGIIQSVNSAPTGA